MRDLEHVITFLGMQPTGITISDTGRMFVCFPRWHDDLKFSVAEIIQEDVESPEFPELNPVALPLAMPTLKMFRINPYPDIFLNSWKPSDGTDISYFICVQSVIAYKDKLYILDTKNPNMGNVIDTPSIYVFDLETDRFEEVYRLSSSTYRNSYTNDLRIDEKLEKIYITDSGSPGIIVVDIETGDNWRVFDNDQFTTAQMDYLLLKGKPTYHGIIHSDGIALDTYNDVLYIHSLTSFNLYGIPTKQLVNSRVYRHDITQMNTPACDGMIIDDNGNLYMGDIEHNAILCIPYGTEKICTLVQDDIISWPDTFTIYDGYLYFTNSRISEVQANRKIDDMDFPVYRTRLWE